VLLKVIIFIFHNFEKVPVRVLLQKSTGERRVIDW